MIMRTALLLSVVLAASPADAQTLERVEGRVKKLESEMRAVQRKVFPGAAKDYFEPEITAPAAAAEAPGMPASTPISDLTQRVNSLEQQMTTLTGQVEQASFKLRQLEAQLEKFKTDAEFRLTTLEGGPPPPAAGTVLPPPAVPDTSPPPAPDPAASADPIEAEYRAGYALVESKQYARAETALAAFVAKHPKHARASNAQYWLGRTYFAQNRPAEAARVLVENYKARPEGERARESLLWLGKSLMAISPPRKAAACETYQELEDGYGKTLTASLRTQLTEARAAAGCA
jgi:tol-pal system protein YbgF